MDDIWEVYAVKYGEHVNRKRVSDFIFTDDHDSPHPLDYFVWVLKNGNQSIVVDTGFDEAEGKRRDRPIQRDPASAIAAVGVDADTVDKVIITHLHFDHAGGLDRYPNAKFHLQAAEMAYATGPCMCHGVLRQVFTVEHVCEMVKKVYSGRVIFHEGDGQIAPGVTVHAVGGHSRGLQAVRVKTAAGWMCLASDATHFYENFITRNPFPIVVDLEDLLKGFDLIQDLASDVSLVIPGHDPLVTQHFPLIGSSDFVWRLDKGPTTPFSW